jgi:hypothetical protein
VRFSGLRVVGRELSRARLGKAVGVPRGADDPQGPNRPGAGGFARPSPGRGSWGLSFSGSGHPHRAPTPGSATDHGGTRPAASAVPVPQATARPRPSRPTCPHPWPSTWQSVVARRTAGSGPVVAHHGSAAPVRRELAGGLLARVPAIRPRGLDVLVAEEPRGLGLSGAARRPRLFSRFGLVLPGRASPVILALFPRRSPGCSLGRSAHG